MVERFGLVVVALSACGRLGFDDTAGADGGPPDAALGPWATPVPISELNAPNEPDDDPTLTGDLLEIFWDSGRPPGTGGDVFTARRASVSDPFGPASIVTELASTTDDTTPDISPDGLTLYFSSDRATAGDRDIYRSTRPDRTSPWSTPIRMIELSSTTDDGSAIETADRLAIYFSSERTGSGDLFVARRAAPGQPFGAAAPVTGLAATPRVENQIWIDPTATLLYFSTTDPATLGDIWVTTRSAPDEPFASGGPVAELNTAVDDSDPWLSPDRRTLVFASDRSGQFDLYITTR